MSKHLISILVLSMALPCVANPSQIAVGIFSELRCVRALENMSADELARFERLAEHMGTTAAEKQEYVERRKRTAYLMDQEKHAEIEGVSARDLAHFVQSGMRYILERGREKSERDDAFAKLVEEYDAKILADEPPGEGRDWLRAELRKWPTDALAGIEKMKAAANLMLARAGLAHWRAEVSKELLKAPLTSTVTDLAPGARRRLVGRASRQVGDPGEIPFDATAVARHLLEHPRVDPFIKSEIERELDFMGKLNMRINKSPAGLHYLKMAAAYYQLDLSAFASRH